MRYRMRKRTDEEISQNNIKLLVLGISLFFTWLIGWWPVYVLYALLVIFYHPTTKWEKR